MVVILAVAGSWFVLNRLVIPPQMKMPALWAFYLSTFTAFVSITQVPYTAVIIAHERMNIYAYLGIFEACAKLGVAYAISLAPVEKLVWYAIMVAAVQLTVAMAYRIYCVRNYRESRLGRLFSKGIFRNMLNFSGWSLIANVTEILSNHGLVVLINMFFAPAVAAAQAVANQISGALAQFSNNFVAAVNPQVIKLYAAGEYKASRDLNLMSTVMVWDLLLFIGLPLIACMDQIIHLWLVDVPPYAVVFARYIVIRQIINTFNITFYIPMVASGELKGNSLASVWLGIGEFVLLYFLLKCGLSVMWVQYISVLQALAYGLGVKPYILCRRIGYPLGELLRCYATCLKIAVLPVAACVALPLLVPRESGVGMMALTIAAIMAVVAACAFFGMKREVRVRMVAMVTKRFHK